MNLDKSYNFVFAGGGTGGHLFPGIAMANYIKKISPNSKILFVGTDRGLEKTLVPDSGFNLETIKISGIKGFSKIKKLKSLMKLPKAISDSSKILSNFNADFVIGLGGYASGPVLLSAWLNNYPSFIMEQNSVPGMTNRALAKLVKKVFTSFEYSHKYFPKNKVYLSGNPVRESIKNIKIKKKSKIENILVFGGSQGAKNINEVLINSSLKLNKFNIIHQTGKNNIEEVEKRYKELNINNVKVTSFIKDMAKAYSNSDLVICRAGATSIAELKYIRKPSILIPFPKASDNHQVLNAKELEDKNMALMIEEKDLSVENLLTKINYLNSIELLKMTQNLDEVQKIESEEIILMKILSNE